MNIFDNIEIEDKKAMLNCLRAVNKSYYKKEIIFDDDADVTSVGYVLNGRVRLLKDDYDGHKFIVDDIMPDETFGEALVCSGIKNNKITVVAVEDSEILFLDFKRILSVCQNSCQFHRKLIENLVKIISQKNIYMQERLDLLSKKTLRERILHFLNSVKDTKDESIFQIPYSREQMAEYLAIDRSALSRELAKMKSEKILDYHKNSFRLY